MSFLPPPAEIDAEVFVSLPENFRKRGAVQAWAVINKGG
jgi:hypothetical protein